MPFDLLTDDDYEAELDVHERALQIDAARRDPNAFIEYAFRGEGGRPLRQEPGHREWQQIWTDHEKSVVLGSIGTGKALPVETPIAVPGGWKPLGELQVGDLVIGGDGKPTRVTYISPVWTDHEVFEFEFDDRTTLRSDGEHQWSAWNIHDRAQGRPPRTVTTRDIIANFNRPNGQKVWSIPLVAPVEHPARDLTVHPYVLGVWLGDGDSESPRLTCHEDDAEIVDRCIVLEDGRCGARVYEKRPRSDGKPSRVFTQVVGGVPDKRQCLDPRNLRGRLRALGLIENKHIPAVYMTASVQQRRELLAGLMDTDGTVCRKTGRVEFTSVNLALAHGVLELARSLGLKAFFTEGRAMLKGRDVGPKYRVGWTNPAPVFRLRRKHEIHAAWVERRKAQGVALRPRKNGSPTLQRNTWDSRVITAWRRVPTVPVRCIAVEAEHHTYVATDQYVVTHNTSQVRGRLLWEIGHDPDDTRIAYVSATQAHPKKQLGSLKEEIVLNPRVRHVFPNLRPGEGEREIWSSTQILVARDSMHPDVTLEVYGLYGSILGSRKTIIVFDDLCNFANTLTETSREKMADWLAEVLSRLKGKTRIWAIGHIWHEEDALQILAKKEGWYYARYEATRRDPETGIEKPTFPSLLPPHKIAGFCADLGPIYSEMMLWNRMPPATASRFKARWFEQALQAGRGLSLRDPRTRDWTQPFCASWSGAGLVYTAVDFGHTKKLGSDLTVLVTGVLFPDGTRRVIDVRSGRWKADEIVGEILDLRERFDPTFFLESNGGQQLFADLVEGLFAVPVNKSHTGEDKYHYQNGIEGLGSELRAGLWILPCDTNLEPHEEVAAMIKGAKGYDPRKHPSDHLMAWWILRKAMVQYPRGLSGAGETIDPQGHV